MSLLLPTQSQLISQNSLVETPQEARASDTANSGDEMEKTKKFRILLPTALS